VVRRPEIGGQRDERVFGATWHNLLKLKSGSPPVRRLAPFS
jgi:hypothetical protein